MFSCAHPDSDVGFIVSTLCTVWQRVDCVVGVVRVSKRYARILDVWIGMNLANKIVIRLVDLHIYHATT